MEDISITQLRTLTTVATVSSMSEAADVLRLAPSTVTGHIRKLEAQLGAALVSPLGRGITLTADGEALNARGRELLSAHDDIVRELSPPGPDSVVVAATEHAAQFLVPEILRALRELLPEHTIRLRLTRSDKARHMIENERADIAVTLRHRHRHSTHVADLPLEWIGSRGAPTDRIVVFAEPCAVRHQAVAALRGRPHRIERECSDLASVLAAVSRGAGVTPLPRIGQRGRDLEVVRSLPTIPDVPLYLAVSPRIGARTEATLRQRILAHLSLL